MVIKEALENKNMSVYKLAKISGVPYATANDIVNEKTQLEKCTAETVYRIARALEIPMEELLEPYLAKRSSFENFKSSVCHRVRELGEVAFVADTLEHQEITVFFKRKWYPESLYLLAMLDYLSRENNIPLCEDYEDIRKCRLEKPVYPAGVLALSAAAGNDSALKEASKKAIPEFKRFNIIECEVRDAV